MKFETIKSFILVVLIVISLVLSLSLWSYQPNSERALRGEVLTNEMNVGGTTEETKRSIVKPSDIIFHTVNGPYGFTEATLRDQLYEAMQGWVITDFESSAASSRFGVEERDVELQFDDDIPMGIMNNLFTFDTEEITFPQWSINRIYIYFIEESKSLYLEFESEENNRISTGIINHTDSYETLYSKVENLDQGEELTRYLAVNKEDARFYIPEQSVSLPAYTVTPRDINPSLFVNILFRNPSVVRETSSQSIGETYFTDNRQMSVYQNRMRMEFVNHAAPTTIDENITISEVDLLDRAIGDINNHGGWTGNYRLNEIDFANRMLNFQLHYEGIPVFNNYKLSTIQQTWGIYQNSYQLLEYERPLFSIERAVYSSDHVELTSGQNVVAYLENDPDIVLENIQDIKVSYEMKYQLDEQDSEYIQLEPAWYKKENNNWQRIIFDEQPSSKGGR